MKDPSCIGPDGTYRPGEGLRVTVGEENTNRMSLPLSDIMSSLSFCGSCDWVRRCVGSPWLIP